MSSDIIVISPNRRPSEIAIGDSANLDAFSRVRVSDPTTLSAMQLQYDADPLQIETGTTGTGAVSYNSNTRMLELSATAGTGTAFGQTWEYIPYQPGKSQFIKITGVMDAAVSGAIKHYGYFDGSNGIYYRQNGAAGLEFVRRTSTGGSVVNNAVPQTDWNIDRLDGTGASGITLDVEKDFILIIDLQFLAMGRVRIGFDIDGVVIYAHEMKHANILSVPYMQTATLPIQVLLTATSTATTATMKFKCAAVESEGGYSTDIGYPNSTTEVSVSAASGTDTHLVSIRPLTTFNSITNRSLFRVDSVELIVTGTNPILYKLSVGATFSVAPTFAAVNATYSAFAQGTGGTLTSPGYVIKQGYVVSSAPTKSAVSATDIRKIPVTLDRAGAVRSLGTFTVSAQGVGGSSAMRALINYVEVR